MPDNQKQNDVHEPEAQKVALQGSQFAFEGEEDRVRFVPFLGPAAPVSGIRGDTGRGLHDRVAMYSVMSAWVPHSSASEQ